MKLEEVDKFESVQSQLQQLHKEMSVLAKSKPDNPINSFKLRLINDKLKDANSVLVDAFRPIADFETFSEDALPTNSDVVLVLAQYLESLEGWRSANVIYSDYKHGWYWDTEGGHRAESTEPTRFRQASSGRTEKPREQPE